MPRPRRVRSTAELQEQLRATRSDIRAQVQQTRAQFDEANARLTARSGRNLVFAIGFGVVLGALVIASLTIVKPLFVLVVMALAGFGVSELAAALMKKDLHVPRIGSVVAAVAAMPVAYLSSLPSLPLHVSSSPAARPDSAVFPAGWLLAVVGAVVLAAGWLLVRRAVRGAAAGSLPADLLHTIFVQLYVTGLGTSAVVLLAQPRGQWWVLAFLIVVVSSDVFAYATGLRFGRHKMAPHISPGKTWEGFAGAAVATVVIGLVLAPLLMDRPLWFGAVFGVVILVTGTLGDLGESMIKRDIGVKDMSSWLPGHGGILDRIDSVLPSAAAALLLYLLTT